MPKASRCLISFICFLTIALSLSLASKQVLANTPTFSPAASSNIDLGNVSTVNVQNSTTLTVTHSGAQCPGNATNEEAFQINLTDGSGNPLPEPFSASPSSGSMPKGQNKTATFTIYCTKNRHNP